jgi:cbb3-type cytochrome oxidase subunit 3
MRQLTDDGGSLLPIISLVLFVAFFVGVIVYIVTDRRRGHLARMESLPLDDDHSPEERSHG